MQAVAVPSSIVAGNAVEVLATLLQATSDGGPAPQALDLAPLKEFDSCALSMLLQLGRSRHGEGQANGAPLADGPPLVLLNPPAKLQELAELYGVAEMLFGASTKLPS